MPRLTAKSKEAQRLGGRPLSIFSRASDRFSAFRPVMRPAGLEKGIGIISAGYLKEPTDPQ
jgi:hypothetical protein